MSKKRKNTERDVQPHASGLRPRQALDAMTLALKNLALRRGEGRRNETYLSSRTLGEIIYGLCKRKEL